MGNRAYLLSLPFAPHVFGERPPSGAIAFAQYSIPFFWASLFDARSIVRPLPGSIHGLAAPRIEALVRSERRLRECTDHFGWSSWPLGDRWIEFLLSLQQPWIAVDVHEIDHGITELSDVLRRLAAPPNDLAFTDYFGRFLRERPAEDALILAGVDHEDCAPPRPLARLHSSAPPSSGPQPVWKYAVEGLLGESNPDAWIRWFPTARASSFGPNVATVGPGMFISFDRDVARWTVMLTECQPEVLGSVAQLFDPTLVQLTCPEPSVVLLRSRRAACSSTLRQLA